MLVKITALVAMALLACYIIHTGEWLEVVDVFSKRAVGAHATTGLAKDRAFSERRDRHQATRTPP
jgi:hypothetical protein